MAPPTAVASRPPVEISRPGGGRALAQPLATAALAASAVGLLAVVDPGQPGHYPLCPFRAMTGLDCPGCGTLRSIHDLATGNPAGALDHNLLAVATVPLLLLVWLGWVRRAWTGAPRPAPKPRWVPLLVLGVVLAWWVVRNIPGVPFLGSGVG